MARKSKPPREMVAALIQSMPSRTGKSLAQWIRIVKSKGPKTRKERIAWLRSTHGIGLPTAMVIASETEGKNLAALYDDHDGLVDAMYQGKENLRPIYDIVAKSVKKTREGRRTHGTQRLRHGGAKAAICGASTVDKIAPEFRARTPGRPSQGRPPSEQERRRRAGHHRIALEKKSDFNAEAKKWLKTAFDGDA